MPIVSTITDKEETVSFFIPSKYKPFPLADTVSIKSSDLNKLYHLYKRSFITLDQMYKRIVEVGTIE